MGLIAGTYDLVVTDANLCTETLSHTITKPSDLVVVLDSAFDSLLCQGDSDGTINITASGGTVEYT